MGLLVDSTQLRKKIAELVNMSIETERRTTKKDWGAGGGEGTIAKKDGATTKR